MDLSTIFSGSNGEFAPYDGDNWGSGFILDFSGTQIEGTMVVGLPPFADEDGDGFDDFFHSAHPVSGTSSGTYQTAISTGTITATWNRGALSKDGTCVLRLVDNIYGLLGDFSHTFELLEYTGPVLYTPGANAVSNRFSLKQTGAPENAFSGAYLLSKNSTNRFNELFLPAGILTNTTLGKLRFLETSLIRELPWTTNYYGFVDFQDGNSGTIEPDYLFWTLSIDDLNDANRNGIPDFSDTPVVRAPVLSIALDQGNPKLGISGAIGGRYLLLEAASMTPASWKTNSTIVITNDPQTVQLPRPQVNRFWRLLAQ